MSPHLGLSSLCGETQDASALTGLAAVTTPLSSQQASPSSPSGFWGSSNISRQPKQIRTPRAPLYVPAVLRPTEKPSKSSPPSSGDSAVSQTASVPSLSTSAVSAETASPLMHRMVTEEWLDANTVRVGGPPSRNHWKADPSSDSCDSPTCDRSFTLLIRRHHCRRCGCIFCAEHSPHTVPLDEHARFHPRAPKYRACDDCYRDYRVWEAERLKRLALQETDSLPVPPSTMHRSIDANAQASNNAASVAQSVPSNWNWSTF